MSETKADETKPSKTKPKKMVSLNVVVSLGIICILLIGITAYFSITGISAQNNYNNLQNQNKQLQTWLAGNETLLNQIRADNANFTKQIEDQNNTISQLQSNITNLENQIANDNATITSLENSIIPTVSIASVTEDNYWWETFQALGFAVNVTNSGTDTVKGINVAIIPYPQRLGNPYSITLDFGTIAPGASQIQGTGFPNDVGGGAPIMNYALVTLSLANITLNAIFLQFNTLENKTWIFS